MKKITTILESFFLLIFPETIDPEQLKAASAWKDLYDTYTQDF